MSSTSLFDRVRVELKEGMVAGFVCVWFFLFYFFCGGGFGLKFAEWESIDRDEIIDRVKSEREAMTRALMIVYISPSGSLLTVVRSFTG